jgi:hypothetical protein
MLFLLPRGDALRSAQRLPLAIIFRAFGAAVCTSRAFGAVSAETDGGLIKASALRQGSMSLQYTCRMLEGELKSELDFARSCVAVKATKT